MKMIGIIGGIGPESTIDYYRQMIALYRERTGGADYPPLLVNSIDMTKMLALVSSGDREALADYLAGETGRLEAAGAGLALMASNTPHIVFDRVKSLTRIPMLSIVEETARRAKRDGFARLGLFGTRFTMQGGFYQSVFAAQGMEVVTPPVKMQEFIHEHYMGEFVNGIFREEVKRALVEEAKRLKRDERIDALILGGTELPLIIGAADLPGMGVLNTTAIHVESAVGYVISHNGNARG